MSAYDELMTQQRQTEALSQIAGRLGWDQETMMPHGAAAQRAEESGALELVLHARRSDPRLGELLDEAEDEVSDPTARAQLRHIRRSFERATKIPADLAQRLAERTSLAHGQWARARADEDVAAFLPALREVVALKREEAVALAEGGDLYDALLQDYEPGETGARLAEMFSQMRPVLNQLREQAMDGPAVPDLSGHFPAEKQMNLARVLASCFGYDWTRGRLDKSVHPFSSGSGADVRITTRVDEADPFNCIYSTIHETGHACYEQGIDSAYVLTPLGAGVSMGVHESQSRIYENQLGRSRGFCDWLFVQMREAFGELSVRDAAGLYRTVNRVKRGYIRTEADELQYNLHVMLRFDLERALLSGDLLVDDLESAWNDRFAADFGYEIDKPSNGCLQDVHWSAGLIGYFPTYTLGNVYAGCLNAAMRQDLPDLDDDLSKGELGRATGWLQEKVQRHGGLYEPRDVIERATGGPPDAGPLLSYLTEKFSELSQA